MEEEQLVNAALISREEKSELKKYCIGVEMKIQAFSPSPEMLQDQQQMYHADLLVQTFLHFNRKKGNER